MTKSLILGAALAVALGGVAAAQDTRAGRVDRDGDRRVSLAEMQTAAAARFARNDLNRDGQLTRDERKAARQTTRAQRVERRGERQNAVFARRDANRDGVLAQAEARRRLQARFAQLDANRDGGLTQAELQAGRQAIRTENRADRQAMRAEKRAARQAQRAAGARGDGVLTLAEMQARVSARFARLDANRDGFVTRDERRGARAGQRG